MTRSITIPSGVFTEPGLPVSIPYSKRMLVLPGLKAWFNGLQETVVRDADSRLVQWRDRSLNRTAFEKSPLPDAQMPLYVPSVYMGRNALRFTKARGDALKWTGQRAIGATRHTTIMIADFKPKTTTPQHLVSDIVPDGGWNALIMKLNSDGAANISIAAGPAGSVGKSARVETWLNVARPMLVIAVVDNAFGAVKMKINNLPISITTGVSPTLLAADVNIGSSGFADTLPNLGVDMDLYELIMLEDDIFADGRQGHLGAVTDYANAAYGIW